MVILFFFALILSTNKKINYPNSVLWGLTLWGILHMAGGSVPVAGGRLYELILIPISETYAFFRYDQFVHIIGFGVATFVAWILLKPHLKEKIIGWKSLRIAVCMAGLGFGALNEIIEFFATMIIPQTGVGGYINTSMDLVADFVGAIIAVFWIRIKNGRL